MHETRILNATLVTESGLVRADIGIDGGVIVEVAEQGSVGPAQTELVDYYRKKRPDLTAGARAYLALLNSLDVLAYAADRKLLDGQVAADYLKTLLTPDVISLTFIGQFQECCGDTSVYEHLEAFLTKYRWLRKPTISGS